MNILHLRDKLPDPLHRIAILRRLVKPSPLDRRRYSLQNLPQRVDPRLHDLVRRV
uniref:Uncharacterized protein n=1 Tax=Lotus japonicus TaxID=34305 RepID=I3SAC3_LOTJA|nr:unknown [Lotus japonicus]